MLGAALDDRVDRRAEVVITNRLEARRRDMRSLPQDMPSAALGRNLACFAWADPRIAPDPRLCLAMPNGGCRLCGHDQVRVPLAKNLRDPALLARAR
jgi:hypothetical protein